VYANTAAESVLGRALEGERRESLEILTKVYWPTGPGGPNDSGLSRKHIRESIDASLRRLKTEYVDVYQAHRYDHETPLEETMGAFADVVRRGHELARAMSVPFVSNQPQYNMLWRVIEAEVVPASQELGIGQIVWSPIAQGVLTGKYRPGEAPPEDSRAGHEEAGQLLRGRMSDDVLDRVQRLKPIADQAGLSLAQLAIAWVLANPAVSSAIIGASRPEQVSENAKAAGQRLSADLMEQIDEALEPAVTRDPRQTKSPPNRDFG
jgi:aryl-alcohol dehydrogenase-like predicted oxidoreductase